MISVMALTCLLAPDVKVVELPADSAQTIQVRALIQAPTLNSREDAALRVLAATLETGTRALTRGQILGALSGVEPLRIEVHENMLIIRFSVPKDAVGSASLVLDAMLREPDLEAASVNDALDGVMSVSSDLWARGLSPIERPFQKVKIGDVQDVFRRVFRQENVTIVYAGALAAGSGIADASDRFASWRPKPALPPRGDVEPKRLLKWGEPATVLELASGPFKPDAEDAPARTLAMFALGVGKGSALFKSFREAHQWSYRQEAILWPVAGGWMQRVVWAEKPSGELGTRFAEARAALRKEIEGWTDKDFRRAVAMFDAVFERGFEFSPFWLGNGPIQGDALKVELTLLFAAWGIPKPDTSAFQTRVKSVTLDQLRAAALSFVESARGQAILGASNSG